MTVRPRFDVSQETWAFFKKAFPDFEDCLAKFEEVDPSTPLPAARNRFLLNLFSKYDAELNVYLNPGPPITLSKERLTEFNKMFRNLKEKEESAKFLKDKDADKLRKLPPLKINDKSTTIETILWAFEEVSWNRNNPFDFYFNSLYNAMEMVEWFKREELKHTFEYLPEDNPNAYLIRIYN